nr:MAG TPA: hypothetical protein [Caudoviricetes sp.]DAN11819.1 MAG TPA: hypothetical protein [Caudoviricetes sp.]
MSAPYYGLYLYLYSPTTPCVLKTYTIMIFSRLRSLEIIV